MKPKICIVVAAEYTLKAFLLDQIRAMTDHYQVTVVANTASSDFLKKLGIDAEVVPVRIERKINVFADIQSLVRLFKLFRKGRFNIVHSFTPKAGLLAMLGGWLAGVPIRVHTFTGQVWATRTGLSRTLLKAIDRLFANFATNILVDSFSQRQFLIDQGVVSVAKSSVLAQGSVSGVDTVRFSPNPEARQSLRNRLGISENDRVFLYLGRLNKDKGVLDLVRAFAQVYPIYHDVYLLIVGPDEENLIPHLTEALGATQACLYLVGYTDCPQDYMAAADVLCLPSYREGFGSVIIEAASVGIPAIASRIYGVTDAVQDGLTGLLHAPGDVGGITEAMRRLLDDPDLRLKMGIQAQARAHRDFSKETLTSALLDYYSKVLAEA